MKAAVYSSYGPPEVLQIQEVEKPVPKDNEVLVRVRTTTVCTADWRLRKADPVFVRFMNGFTRPTKIRVLGMEFSGNVEAVGKAVTRFSAGDAVFGGTGFHFGTYAEYVCMPEDDTLAKKPANASWEESAAVYFGGFTALMFLRKAHIQAGHNVLIYGASGSVGTAAVQLAKHFGARVTAVCSTRNVELVKSLGADQVIDYTREDFSQGGRVYDIVFDTVGYSGFARCMKVLKRGGSYAQGGYAGIPAMLGSMFGSMWMSFRGKVKVAGMGGKGTAADLALLKEIVEAGNLKPVIDRRYSFEQIAEAHRYAQTGRKKGNLVVTVETAGR